MSWTQLLITFLFTIHCGMASTLAGGAGGGVSVTTATINLSVSKLKSNVDGLNLGTVNVTILPAL
ncbi:hypothetical protein [Leptospira wolffii]|nr:hypothetical protein [Leptospira wolffii]